MFGYMLVLVIVTAFQGVQLEEIYTERYLGCYKDDSNNRTLEKELSKSNSNNGDECKQRCKNESDAYRYAGTEFGKECFCGNNINEDLKLEDSMCSYLCSGNNNEHCGGSLRLSVYDTWLCATEPCMNSTSCEDINGTVYNCLCPTGWGGNLCDQETATTTNTKILITETSSVDNKTVTSSISPKEKTTAMPTSAHQMLATTRDTNILITETSTTATSDMNPTGTAMMSQIVTYKYVLIAVAIIVVVLVVLAVIAIVSCLKRRRGRRGRRNEEEDNEASVPTHNIYTSSLIDHESKQHHTADNDTNNIRAGGMSKKSNGFITHTTNTRQGGHMELNPTSNTRQEPDSDYNTLNSVSDTLYSHGDGNTYNHVNIAPIVDKTYSHLPACQCNSNDGTYSHTGRDAGQLSATDAEEVDETYNNLQMKNKLRRNLNVIEEAEYDHAVSVNRDNGTNETVKTVEYNSAEPKTDTSIQEYVYATVVKTKL